LGGEIDTVSQAFDRLAASAEGGADGLLRALQIGTRGTVDNLSLMKSANQAIQLLGEESIEHLPRMAEIAFAAAKATGGKVSDMFRDLIVATGRKSVMILDNLNISSSAAARYQEEYARNLGLTRAQLNATQKSAAFYYAVMKAGGDLIRRVGSETLTFGERLQVAQATFESLKQTLATELIPAWENMLTAFTSDDTAGAIQQIKNLGKSLATLMIVLKNLAIIGYKTQKIMKTIMTGGWLTPSGTQENVADIQSSIAMMRRDAAAIRAIWSDVETSPPPNPPPPGDGDNDDDDDDNGPPQRELDLQAYYDYTGQLQQAELAREEEHYQKLISIASISAEQRLAIEEAHQKKVTDIHNKYNIMRATLQAEWTSAVDRALGSFESSTKKALSDTILGKGGWKDWQKNLKQILADLVVDILWAIAKAKILQALTVGTAIGSGGAAGGFTAGLVSGFLEKGNVPMFAKGNIPMFSGGNIPRGHELVLMDYKREAVINAESTRRYSDILSQINSNPQGGALQSGGVTINASFSGNVMTRDFIERDVVKVLDDIARQNGTELFKRQGI